MPWGLSDSADQKQQVVWRDRRRHTGAPRGSGGGLRCWATLARGPQSTGSIHTPAALTQLDKACKVLGVGSPRTVLRT